MAAAAAVGYPFTAAQWKELERQAMIYKYMVASLPVPPHLLYASSFPTTNLSPPLPTTSSYWVGKYGNGLNFSWSGNNKDTEPERCRRTDGKKWRCSRDAAPNHKYCERHLHRGRPRSRKPVELPHHHPSLSDFPVDNTNKKNSNDLAKKARSDGPITQPAGPSLPLILPSKASTFDHPMGSAASPFKDSRGLAWNEEQQWQQLAQANVNALIFQQQYEGVPLNQNSQSDFSSKSEMVLLERPLIDAWSRGVAGSKDNEGIRGNAVDEEMCQIHMGLGVIDSWVASHSSPGGPLAEVLRPGPLTVASRPISYQVASDAGESDLVTPPATAVSSPSGVLQRTLASVSDSSGSNSPTCQHSKANSDMPFHWLN